MVHSKHISGPENSNVTCPSNTSVFQDMCTYYCNHGYQLDGNRQTRFRADGTWSSEPVTWVFFSLKSILDLYHDIKILYHITI